MDLFLYDENSDLAWVEDIDAVYHLWIFNKFLSCKSVFLTDLSKLQ